MNESYIIYYLVFANETNFTKSAVGKQMKIDHIGPYRIYKKFGMRGKCNAWFTPLDGISLQEPNVFQDCNAVTNAQCW